MGRDSVIQRIEAEGVRDATLIEQLEWLQQAGFQAVDCFYKNFFCRCVCGNEIVEPTTKGSSPFLTLSILY